MNLLQLNPPIPVTTPLGNGIAIVVMDYGVDFNSVWVVMLDKGPIQHFTSKQLKRQKNFTFEVLTK